MFKKEYLGKERRQYIRLDSVFPVRMRLLSLDNQQYLSDWIQGFTNNVSKKGICLQINNLNTESVELIKQKKIKLSLEIELPLGVHPVSALAEVVWVRDIPERADWILIGARYERIESSQNNRIMRYAWTKRLFLPGALTIIFILGLGFAFNVYLNTKLIKGNKALVNQLIQILQDSSIAKQKIKEINREKQDLLLKIQALELRIQNIEKEKVQLLEEEKTKRIEAEKKIDELNLQIDRLSQEKASIQERLIDLQSKENAVTEELLRLDKKKANLEKANIEKMYHWLSVHQNPRTGLILSFEGSSDIVDWGFIYDQALAAQVYNIFSDYQRVKKIFDFFQKKAKRKGGLFFNAYYVSDGLPAEYIIHSGPNIWLGIAILQYTKKTQDTRYLDLAEEIARVMMDLQNQDKEGGIRGGPDNFWYSTEHNLDAYAFFNMLYKITAKEYYLKAADKIINWLLLHTYDHPDVPVRRGKGDATIATDTYAWSIASLGPQRLEQLGMNPDSIMEFAEDNCKVEVSFIRPEGRMVRVKGFDFAPQRNLARGGVVSVEWTAQMIISFKIMADYYYKKEMVAKARSYERKAEDYMAELANMIISSPSASGQGESCLPYASQDYVDTGHGWFTPKGKSTGSVAATAYTLFAYYNYNPLQLEN
ncbi:MAG: hypothetical protein NC908_01685 [Candidatus Omnitrophica bacterium]|nr:hypothetical protein [Candidatus Omnitrophota bacterium]